MSIPYEGDSPNKTIPGVYGTNNAGGDGVFGSGTNGGRGTVGVSDTSVGVCGNSTSGFGVWGETQSKTAAGVSGYCDGGGDGVSGNAVGGGRGVVGVSDNQTGVEGDSTGGVGVWGQSQNAEGVHGISHSPTAAGVAGYNDKGGPAGLFQGNVQINGVLTVAQDIVLTGADCAEDFDLSHGVSAGPGSVMVIDTSGSLAPCAQAYDRRVAGVVSGAGSFRPAFTLDRREPSCVQRSAIALVGKVYCKAVAPVAVGDLLTTSDIPGHAMRAADFTRAAGAVLGKAIGALESGTGLVPMLVALQ
jgi:hypothetical protein